MAHVAKDAVSPIAGGVMTQVAIGAMAPAAKGAVSPIAGGVLSLVAVSAMAPSAKGAGVAVRRRHNGARRQWRGVADH